MELSEAHRTIDATAGFLLQLQAFEKANLIEVEDDEEGLGVLAVRVYTTASIPNLERRCRLKYRSGMEFEFIIPQIAPVCDLIIDNWPSPSAKKLRSHIDESNVLYLANEILGLDDPMMYETVPEAYEYQAMSFGADRLRYLIDEIYDINYRVAYALRMTDEDENNEDESDEIFADTPTDKRIDLNECSDQIDISTLPEEFQSSEAEHIMQKLLEAGMLDANWQPVNLSIAERGYLADEISSRLKIKSKWKVLGALWNENSETLRQGKNKAVEQTKTEIFIKKLKIILG